MAMSSWFSRMRTSDRCSLWPRGPSQGHDLAVSTHQTLGKGGNALCAVVRVHLQQPPKPRGADNRKRYGSVSRLVIVGHSSQDLRRKWLRRT